jgi:hypothetical protein
MLRIKSEDLVEVKGDAIVFSSNELFLSTGLVESLIGIYGKEI